MAKRPFIDRGLILSVPVADLYEQEMFVGSFVLFMFPSFFESGLGRLATATVTRLVGDIATIRVHLEAL